MAPLLPSEHLPLGPWPAPREPESEALRRLQTRLPSAYTVFHGVPLVPRVQERHSSSAELDFMVVNQGGKALANPLNERDS